MLTTEEEDLLNLNWQKAIQEIRDDLSTLVGGRKVQSIYAVRPGFFVDGANRRIHLALNSQDVGALQSRANAAIAAMRDADGFNCTSAVSAGDAEAVQDLLADLDHLTNIV